MLFAGISMTICARWASATWRFRGECGASARRFTAGRPLTSAALMRTDQRELEKALARNIFGSAAVRQTSRPRLRATRAPRRANLKLRTRGHARRRQGGVSQPGGSHMLSLTRTRAPAEPWQCYRCGRRCAETGEHFDLVADAESRAAVARVAGLRELPRLEASFEVTQARRRRFARSRPRFGDRRSDLRRHA